MPQIILERGGGTTQTQGQPTDLRIAVVHAPPRFGDRVCSLFVRPYLYVETGIGIYVGHLTAAKETAHE